VKVLEVSEPQEILTGGNTKREILELKVGDETGTMTLVLWDDRVMRGLQAGNVLQIRNGFVTSYRGEWRINVGKYGEVRKI